MRVCSNLYKINQWNHTHCFDCDISDCSYHRIIRKSGIGKEGGCLEITNTDNNLSTVRKYLDSLWEIKILFYDHLSPNLIMMITMKVKLE